MRTRLWLGCLVCLLCGVGAWFFWHHGHRSLTQNKNSVPTTAAIRPASASPTVSSPGRVNTNPAQISLADWNTNRFAGRLSNTTRSIGQLVNDDHAILLANALMDTSLPLNFAFPKNLQSQGDPGAYIVQARGPIDRSFRAMLAQAGATMVAYIPNNAYLVRASASVAGVLGANPQTQSVIPYEPYYKIQSPLLPQAVRQTVLPDNTVLTLGLFADDGPATTQQIEKLGGQVVGNDRSPFGPVVRVIPPKNWTALATLPGVQIVEPFHRRALANDLSRATAGVAADSLTATNYLNLTGSNIIVEVNDTGIDAQHPDFNGSGARVIGDAPPSLTDTFGHGTHVAGIIAGDGTKSTTVTNAPGSPLTNIVGGVLSGSPGQFRGMAPGATLYSVGGIFGGAEAASNFISDMYFQEVPAQTNALISNNSWVFEGDGAYDLSAASYDAAVRDALPFVTGSQPVLFVFAAGNAGNGGDDSDFGGGIPDSIESPATAKDVITVGALQENRDITNVVTTIHPDGTTNTSRPWQLETSTSYRVAGFSSRGNVGIGIEGNFGRYKPDVCAPGTFIVSTRSEQWDIGTYFFQDPTNNQTQFFSGLVVQPGSIFSSSFPSAPTNAVQLSIDIFPNANSPFPFPNLPVFVGLFTSAGYDFIGANNPLLIPGDPNAPALYLQQIFNTEGFLGAFNYAVSNNTANPISFDLETDVLTTNGTGDYFLVLSNLNQTIGTPNPASTGPGPYYRYETGTSMATPAVSGTLALMQQFYANAYGARPSPAMLKAMLINGARSTGFYNYQAQNTINYEGWGLINLPDSLPPGITNQLNTPCSTFIQDQNPTNALATGDRQTWLVAATNALPMRVTLAWTDPPGDPAAAIKLVNNLVLVVTNLSDPTNPIVYYGNDIPASSTVNSPRATNTPPVFDSINNVQNVNLPLGAGTSFSVTVLGYRVNVNAVTAQTNNVVQDYALVISCGNGGVTNAMTVTGTPAPTVSNPTGDQQVTYVTQTAVGNTANVQLLLNQLVGANSPLLGTGTLSFPAGANGFGPNNWQVTVGQTNQWHFYVVTNTSAFTNAAFVTFNPNAPDPDTLSVPRMGVFGGSTANATRDADIDLYVTTDPSITNLNPVAISNCIAGTQIGAAPGATFKGASLGRGTTEFVVDTNAWSRSPHVYYVGVKSEDQMAAEYGFFSIFSQTPFSVMQNGNQVVNGQPVPMEIPDGSPALPGKQYIFGIAIYPMNVGGVTLSDSFTHQNFGDLIGTLTLNGAQPDVLNNHDSFGNPPGPYSLIYDDTVGGGIANSRPSDGPGSLNNYIGQQSLGVWMLTEVDDSLTQTGRVESFNMVIQPHQDLTLGNQFTNLPPNSFLQVGFVDVPPGANNLTITVTNVTPPANPPVQLFVQFGHQPSRSDFGWSNSVNNTDLVGQQWGSVSIGPPLVSGRYFVGIYNPSPTSESGFVFATIGLPFVPAQTIYNSTDTPTPILDDAVTTDSIVVTNYAIISSLDVGIAVQHPRISDLVFHLISPDGTRLLLMENRGGTDPNGAGGITTVTTNVAFTSTFEGPAGDYLVGQTVDGWVVTGNQVSVQTDPANANQGTNLLALANGTLSTSLATVPGATYTLTFAYRGPGLVGWWRSENNTNDSSGFGNNAISAPGITYQAGEVGRAFNFNGSSSSVTMGPSASLAVTNLTFEGWIFPTSTRYEPIIDYGGPGQGSAAHLWVNGSGFNTIPGAIYANLRPNANVSITSPAGTVPANAWSHVAFTYNIASATELLYYNGGQVARNVSTPDYPPSTGEFVNLGWRNNAEALSGTRYVGLMDEISIYSRALSASEIKAIYNDGTSGKFDPTEFPLSAPQSIAEAQVSVNGGTPTMVRANNTNTTWQTYTTSFRANSPMTTLQIQGLEPGMLLDAASVTAVITNYNYLVFTENTNLTTTPIKFAVPPFTGNITVNTNGIPILLGPLVNSENNHRYYLLGSNTWTGSEAWAKQLGGHLPTIRNAYENGWIETNLSGFGGIDRFVWTGFYDPTKDINGLPHASNFVWVSGEPITYTHWNVGEPSDTAGGEFWTHMYGLHDYRPGNLAGLWNDYANLANVGGVDPVNGVAEVVAPGADYLPEQSLDTFDGLNAHGQWALEIQDDRVGATNPLPVLQSWQLRFNFVTLGTNILPAVPLTLPQLPEQIAVVGQPFTVTNAAVGGTPPYTYALTSSVPFAPFPVIDTNGVITWTPTTNQAPAVYTFTNIVTDTTGLTATDIFLVLVVSTNNLPAFPGAGGPGGPAIGGRGGDVYHVINVNDGGPGSLRYGITNTSGNRTIVFDVSGTINLLSSLVISDPYLTIAGQAAPGDGITLNGYTVSLQNAHDDVLRFLRFRPGDINSPAFQGDSFHFLDVTNSIVDHVSASWSINEALSAAHSTNVTVQWSVIADSLNHSAHYMDNSAPGFETHGFGSSMRFGSGAVGYYHNLYADNYSYNPRPGDNLQLDFINNVVFNWGIFAGVNADDTANNLNGFTNFLNYVGNYFIAGSNTTANPNIAFQANVPGVLDTQIYQGTNFIDNNAGTSLLNGANTGFGMFSGAFTQLGAPTPLPGIPVTFTNPPQAYEQVLAFAGNTMAGASAGGAYLLRDSVDTNIVTGVRGKSGQIIDFISSNRFAGVYLNTSSEATYSGFTGAGTYWQSQGVTNFVGVNPWPVLDSAPQPLDSDGDGIPDYWEITLAALGQTSMNPAVPNNNHLNPDGYTDLEHYINWLAAPHALTVSNTPVDVDLNAIVGRTGNWSFSVANPVNGTVTLANYTATFTPANGVIGFASFDFIATNLVTSNALDVTVSVFVSTTNITYSSVLLSNAKSASNSATNTVPANSIFYYLVKVPTNALFATNRLLSASGPVNLLFSGVGFPTGTNIGDYTLLTGSTGGSYVLSTTSVPTNIVQGGTYYLGVQNTGGTPVTVGVEVDFTLLQTSISGPTITSTNIGGTNGFLLRWSGPTNYQYTIQWKTNLAPVVPWNSVVNPVVNATFTPAGGNYSWFDDGSLAGGFPPVKFYRVVAGLILPPITNSTPETNIIVAGTITPLTVTVPANALAATNVLVSATGPVNVWFNQTTPPTANPGAGDVLMLSGVTGGSFLLNSSSTPPLVPGANYYLGLQNTGSTNVTSVFQVNFGYTTPSAGPPIISGITITNVGGSNAVLLTWTEPTNYQFQVEWATNFTPAIAWHVISNVVVTWSGVVSPTNAADGLFQFLDDGSLTGGWGPLKFYRLIEYPYSTPIPQSLIIVNTGMVGGAVQFQWMAPTNYQYEVLWTTNLGLPLAGWSVLANPVLGLSNGVYTFRDTNQTAPSTGPKFFRLLEH